MGGVELLPKINFQIESIIEIETSPEVFTHTILISVNI